VPTPTTDPQAETAMAHLSASDPVMARLVSERGHVALTPTDDYFFTLLEAMASQQLSSKAADTIVRRILALVPGKKTPGPEDVLALPDQALRDAGLSWSKVSYLKDLAAHVVSGSLPLDHIAQMPDEEAIAALVEVKGIGRWTAEMFLIFSMARPDVLAVDDYGLRAAMMGLYSLPELPKPAAMREVAEPWRPYRSYASLYLWRSRDGSAKVQEPQLWG
jgi:DNA-3-methyladenine glycosylase II